MIVIRGAGDISTGTIHRLFRAGFPVLALESERPSAIRRKAAFSEAVYDGTAEVEGVKAVRISDAARAEAFLVFSPHVAYSPRSTNSSSCFRRSGDRGSKTTPECS